MSNSTGLRFVEYSVAIIQRGGKKNIYVSTIEWRGRGERRLADDEQKARVYAHKVDLAPTEYAYRTWPPIVIPHRRCQALLTRQFCHGNAPILYFNARKEIIRVNIQGSTIASRAPAGN